MSGAKFVPKATRLLVANNDFFTAGAVWTRENGQWTCTRTAPCLYFLRHTTPATAKLELAKRGYSWQWRTVFEPQAPLFDTEHSDNKSERRTVLGDDSGESAREKGT